MIKFVLFLFLLNFFNAGLMGPDKKKEKKYKMTKPKIVEVPNLEWGGKVAEDNWSNLFF